MFVARQVAQGAHVVQAVGQLDQHDAHIIAHGQQHLADVFHFAVDGATAARVAIGRDILHWQILELGDAVHQQRDGRAELALQVDDGEVAVFHDIVQQTGGDGLGVHFHVGEDAGDGDAMREVGFAGAALLPAVGMLGAAVGGCDQLALAGFAVGKGG